MHIPEHIKGILWIHRDLLGMLRVLEIPEGHQDRLNPERARTSTIARHPSLTSFLGDDYIELDCLYSPKNMLLEHDVYPYREEVIFAIASRGIAYKAFMLTSVPTLSLKPGDIRNACEEGRKFTCSVRVWL